MRIIEAKTPIVKEKKKTCRKCYSKLAYTSGDIQHDREGKYIICPSCKVFIGVE